MTDDRAMLVAEDSILTVQVGEIGVSVQSALRNALEDLRELYAGFPPCRQTPLVRLQARPEGRSLLGRRRYAIYGDEQRIFARLRTGEVLPHLEWAANWRVVARAESYVQIHAATLIRECSVRPACRPSECSVGPPCPTSSGSGRPACRPSENHRQYACLPAALGDGRARRPHSPHAAQAGGHALLLVGKSGTGKSTLAAGLLARGWTYYGDEIALLDPQTRRVHPYPKPICIKAGSFEVIRRLGLPLWRRRHHARAVKGPVGFVRPPAADGSELLPRAVRFVVFPEYQAGSEPRLSPMPRGEAAFELARCQVNRRAFGSRAARCLAALARSADCFRLRSGPINSTLDLLEAVFGQAPSPILKPVSEV